MVYEVISFVALTSDLRRTDHSTRKFRGNFLARIDDTTHTPYPLYTVYLSGVQAGAGDSVVSTCEYQQISYVPSLLESDFLALI